MSYDRGRPRAGGVMVRLPRAMVSARDERMKGPRSMRSLAQRLVQPEWLDHLPAADPHARRSRRDLQTVNAWMGNVRRVVRALEKAPLPKPPGRVVELGAGDGTFLLQVARRLSRRWPNIEAVLVDRLELLAPQTRIGLERAGWHAHTVQADVFEWLAAPPGPPGEVWLVNLFLHHFSFEALRRLLQAVADRACFFVACEPERSRLALGGAGLVRLIGCNAVTRHDAAVSVRAGFAGRELSVLWPEADGWEVSEGPAGLFSHLFQARRCGTKEQSRG